MPSQDKSSLQQLTRCGLFTAIALTIFMIEARLPAPLPFPAAKLGLSNCVTLYIAYTMSLKAASQVLFARIILGAIFAGQLLTLLYSAVGGLCCFLALVLLKPFFPWNRLWFVSPCCALAHNLGQLTVASLVMGTEEVFYFFPYLCLLALVSGLFVGLVTQQVVAREKKILPQKSSNNH